MNIEYSFIEQDISIEMQEGRFTIIITTSLDEEDMQIEFYNYFLVRNEIILFFIILSTGLLKYILFL